MSFSRNLYQSYWPWFTPNFRFRSISWEHFDIISLNFIHVCAFVLTSSSLGLLHVIFHTFVPELWPLIYAKISFPLNILRTNGQNFTKFYIICIHIDKILRVMAILVSLFSSASSIVIVNGDWRYLCLFGADPIGVGVGVGVGVGAGVGVHFSFPCIIFWTKRWILTKLAWKHCWEEWDDLIRFWWPWSCFQGHRGYFEM